MKNKKIIISVIIITVIAIIATIFFIINSQTIDVAGNKNMYNEEVKEKNNSKVSWIQNENLTTDNNYADEEIAVKTTNVNTDSLTKITLGEFVEKFDENVENNLLCYYTLENALSESLNANILKGELFNSTKTFYIKGIAPGFKMRISACHPDYLKENFFGACPNDCSIKDFIICNIQFEGDMYYQIDKSKYDKDFQEYYYTNIAILNDRYSDDDRQYLKDAYDLYHIIDPETMRTEEEITTEMINSIEETMAWVYKDFNFSEDVKQDLGTIINCIYWDFSPYLDEKGEFGVGHSRGQNYTNKILSVKWQNLDLENKHEIYVNTGNCKELIIR